MTFWTFLAWKQKRYEKMGIGMLLVQKKHPKVCVTKLRNMEHTSFWEIFDAVCFLSVYFEDSKSIPHILFC